MPPALDDLTERIRAAHAHATPLRIQGGGSKAFHPASARQGEVIDTRALAGVVSYEPSELVITARAGTPLAEVEALLAAHGQYLPFEPPRFGPQGTVGGMVAAGLSGPARASVGAVRDYVLGVDMVNGQGQWLRFGGQVMKNVAGYDVSRLMAASWGRLGLLTEVSLKVLPIALAEATLRFALPQAQALRQLAQWGGQPLPLNASLWREEGGIGLLHVRLRGAAAAVQAACASMGGERIDAFDWTAWRDHATPHLAISGDHALWRLSVPQTAPVLALPPGAQLAAIEWHGGQRWLHAPLALAPALQQVAAQAGGNAIVFRAAGAHPVGDTGHFDTQSNALALIEQRVRAAFDPAGIFQGGR